MGYGPVQHESGVTPGMVSEKVGPVYLSPGVRKLNFWTFMYAAFICIAMLAGMNFMQAYVLDVNLGIPKSEQGFATSLLALVTEIVAILLIVPFGALADRIGRRPVAIGGILFCGLGYGLFPFATSLNELYIYRAIFAIGAASLAAQLPTIGNDYTEERSRGRLFGFTGVMNGLGVIFMSAGLAQIPSLLEGRGVAPVSAGIVMFVAAGGLCVLSAMIFKVGLQLGVPETPTESARAPLAKTLLAGMRAAHNPRIVLSYLAAFAGRSDNAIKGLFISVWVLQVAADAGLSQPQAFAQAGKLMGLMGAVTLLWMPIFGIILDKLNRVTGLALAMALAAAGYGSMGLISSPLDNAMLPFFALLAVGQGSAIIASVTLIGQEASAAERGTIVATNAWFGAIGILIATMVGGVLFDLIGPSAPFVMLGAFQAIVLVFALVVRLRAPGDTVSAA
jgi:MFS family permease